MLKVLVASASFSNALEAFSHQTEISADGVVERQIMRREETRKEPECFREDDWSSSGCPVYDQTKCSSYSQEACTSSCGDGKVCLKLFMSPLSYTCCEDVETKELFDRNAKDAVKASSKLDAGDPPPAPPPGQPAWSGEVSKSAIAEAEANGASTGVSEAAAECYRSDDWSKIGCPKYDQTKCASYSETSCTSGCGTGKVCVKLYMSPLSYSCCEDLDTHQLMKTSTATKATAAAAAAVPPTTAATAKAATLPATATTPVAVAVPEVPGARSPTSSLSSAELPFTGASGSDETKTKKGKTVKMTKVDVAASTLESAQLAQLAG